MHALHRRTKRNTRPLWRLGPALATLAALGIVSVPPPLCGDTVELSGGGHVSGKVRRLDDRKMDIVAIDDEISIALPQSRVRRVVSSNELHEYTRKASAAGEDPEKQYETAIWCATNIKDNTDAYKRFHLQLAIRFDPEHSKARAALDYVKEDGKWIRYSDLQRSRGMISVAGKWMLPEAAAIEEIQDASNVDSKKWIREVDRLLRVAVRGGSKGEEAIASLKAIDDPLAASAIAKQLLQGNHNQRFKRMWVEILGRFHNSVSVEALVRVGVQESDNVIREAAMDELQQYGSGSAVATYVNMLGSSDNGDVLRAARALSYFPKPELAQTYIDALVTKHTKTSAAGPGMQVGSSSGGGGGLSMGGKPKVITRYLENPPVLTLLKMIEPNVDFGYDKLAWRKYFAAKLGRSSGDLRRDP
ncbi:secreted protein [Rhodopirellula maiorica SM1]|uniref:Secreted protein n=1 Tax=Rhodopirellula maiorica SM1 TaxID=1265738 RepID=M5RIT4_9BACT|nr:HEAT repeat domain-containing protein [Rhodopirellula maiorica]EMI19210.1 secreted protein [Rhodopirellula maiorica SM1]